MIPFLLSFELFCAAREKMVKIKQPERKVEVARFASPLAVLRNTEAVTLVRTAFISAGGAACGIVGLTGLAGGITAYIFLHLLASIALLQVASWKSEDYFPQSPSSVKFVLSGILDNVLIFILLWALSYALLHMY
jgi:hypothetical protein